MNAIARIPLTPAVIVDESEADMQIVIQALDVADTSVNPAPAGCACNTARWCERHDHACPCSDRFGRCRRGCAHCFGSSAVSADEATMVPCASCVKAETAETGVRRAVRS
jgi:hypothetical protein